jgi:hypothetical protein
MISSAGTPFTLASRFPCPDQLDDLTRDLQSLEARRRPLRCADNMLSPERFLARKIIGRQRLTKL